MQDAICNNTFRARRNNEYTFYETDATCEKYPQMCDAHHSRLVMIRRERDMVHHGESMLDYVRKIKEEGRYYNAWINRDHPALYFEALRNCGYATDPMYEDKCRNVMRSLPDWGE